MARFGPVLTAMVTPFDDDGALDLDGAAHAGPLAASTTATTASSSPAPPARRPCSPTTSGSTCGTPLPRPVDVPLIAGHGHQRHRATRCELTAAGRRARRRRRPRRRARTTTGRRRPASRPTSGPCAAATDLPVMLYDIPVPHRPQGSPRACCCAWPTRCPTSSALKDAAGDPGGDGPVAGRTTPDGFEVYTGDDALTLPLLAVGAVGVDRRGHPLGRPEMAEMSRAFEKGDVDRRPADQRPLLESLRLRDRRPRSPNPIPTKAMLRALGLPVGQCRLPMGPPDASTSACPRSRNCSDGGARPTARD